MAWAFLALLLVAAFFVAGCTPDVPPPLYPGVEQLEGQGMPAGGTGLPPGATPPALEPIPEAPADMPFLEGYRHGLR